MKRGDEGDSVVNFFMYVNDSPKNLLFCVLKKFSSENRVRVKLWNLWVIFTRRNSTSCEIPIKTPSGEGEESVKIKFYNPQAEQIAKYKQVTLKEWKQFFTTFSMNYYISIIKIDWNHKKMNWDEREEKYSIAEKKSF